MKTSREVTMFVHGNSDDPFIKRLRERLEADLAESEEVMTPFKLGVAGKIKAFIDKYLWQLSKQPKHSHYLLNNRWVLQQCILRQIVGWKVDAYGQGDDFHLSY